MTVPNIGNSCYIDSLLTALFYAPSKCTYLLETDISDVNGIYLQEIIKRDFIGKLQKNETVPHEIMIQIRDLLSGMEWKSHIPDEIYMQQDVNEFYMFLLEKFNGKQIAIQNETLNSKIAKVHNDTFIPFIPLSLPPSSPTDKSIKQVKIQDLFQNWMNGDIKDIGDDKAFDIKHIVNYPIVLPLYLHRFNKINLEGEVLFEKNNTEVFMPKRLRNPNNLSNVWNLHSIICHSGSSPNEGHYYSIMKCDDEFYLFDDLKTPSIQKVSKSFVLDVDITNLIKKESIFLFYKSE